MASDPKVAEAVRAAEAVARQEVPSPLAQLTHTPVRPVTPPAITAAPEPPPAPPVPTPEPQTTSTLPPITEATPQPSQPPLPRRPTRGRPPESTELSDDPPQY
jgi:hypothetical protein